MSSDDINKLFDAVDHKLNGKEDTRRRIRWIFEQALGKSPKTLKAMWVFTRDVTTCPPKVIIFCQQLLAPKALAAE